MASADLKTTLQEALKALYHHPDQQIRKDTNRWLQEFQRNMEAWQVCIVIRSFSIINMI